MTLPIFLSVPHAGTEVPPELRDGWLLTEEDVVADGDEGAGTLYALRDHVAGFLTTPVARAAVDMNRPEDDRGQDGVVKTHTCWDVPIYRDPLPETVVEACLETYHRPYHRRLSEAPRVPGVRVGIDGHTMAAVAPPVAPDAGRERPGICLGNRHGEACPDAWVQGLARELRNVFPVEVTLNAPFSGGFITRRHGAEMPWIQIEFSRARFLPLEEKRERLLRALEGWSRNLGS